MKSRPLVPIKCQRQKQYKIVGEIARMIKRLRKLPQYLRLVAGHLLLIGCKRRQTILVTSMDLADHPTLRALLGSASVFHSRLLPSHAQTYFGWGRKWSGLRAVSIAAAKGTAFELIEDGFLCSVGRKEISVSLVFDTIGIYYDAKAASLLEQLVAATLSPADVRRSRTLMQSWRKCGLSKYNGARDPVEPMPGPYVLVIDQVADDLSIAHGLADFSSFQRMLETARQENPGKTVVVKLHPDALARPDRRHFAPEALTVLSGVQVIADDYHVAHLIAYAETVYTVTSQVGFEALIWGKPVRCFGMPFYAGWGLTDDELSAPDRRKHIPLEQLVHAALVKYPQYIDPITMTRCEPERSFAHVGLQRRKRQEFPWQIMALGFSRWKRPFIQRFLQGSDVLFAKTASSISSSQSPPVIALWGSAEVQGVPSNSAILRIEDGFLRSSGLGADLVWPLSLVIDDIGIYYDATRTSRLEHILETQGLDEAAVRRADELRNRIIGLDLTKYNLGSEAWDRPIGQRPVILVVGQVETDASIRLGSPEVRSNTELLRRVRQENPSAHIVYKPHPDVLAGLRRQGDGERAALAFADEVLARPASLGQLLRQVDEVHTMTSLLGFEALIRGVKVVCHGLPFYAGWGLTEDRIPCPRRTRRLTVTELVHGALIAYPRYFNYEANCFVEPEDAVKQLAALAAHGPKTRSWLRQLLRVAILTWLKLTGSRR